MRKFVIFSLLMLLLAACGGTPATSEQTAEVPIVGDAERGAELFTQPINGAPACATCHLLDGSTLVGPSLQGYGAVAATRVEGSSAEQYTHDSIVKPSSYLVEGFSNVMFAQYERLLSEQEIADLTAYLLTL